MECAKRGNPQGGLRDTLAPVVMKTIPPNYATHFKGNVIEVYFNEYIKLKEIQQELIISPPLKYDPIITPLSTSKVLKIILKDTLLENTTYSFNFGNSIVDNNEENVFGFYKYVFSTGSAIDSLAVVGTVSDALNVKPDENSTLMLYPVNQDFNDSIVFNQKPLYVSNTQQDPRVFSIENIKEGRYLLIGLKDNNKNYKYEPKIDKIGFVSNYINIPSDTTYHLKLFKEVPPYQLQRPSSLNRQQIQFGFEGDGDAIQITLLNQKPAAFESLITKDIQSDSLYYWFKPQLEADTLTFQVAHVQKTDTVQLRLAQKEIDSLMITPISKGILRFDENFQFTANTPIKTINSEKIQVLNQDSTEIDFQLEFQNRLNKGKLSFAKTENQNYKITFLPEAVTDFFDQINDSLVFNAKTRTLADYGFLQFNLERPKTTPFLVQLVTENGEVAKELVGSKEQQTFLFENIEPDNYYVRIIYDQNRNGLWDAGNFLNKLQPEEVIYFPKLLEIRANWTLNETFTLE